ncbi:MAG: endonuclease/exonuclease/phosphatase family protein [Ginsengibacter sp.]
MSRPIFKSAFRKFFIFSNLVVALIFLAGANARYFSPARWWFMGLITISLPYILFILLLFFFYLLFVKSSWALVSILSITLTWRTVQNIIPLHFPSTFGFAKKANTLRIMTWNVEQFEILQHKEHPELKQEMIDLINQFQPDIMCFQEMVAGAEKKAINNIPDFKQKLKFSSYYYSFDERLDFDASHHFGIMVFSKNKIINSKTIFHPPHDYNTTFQYVDILLNTDTIRVFNIHLQSLKFSRANRQYLDKPAANTDTTIVESKNILSKMKAAFIRRGIQADFVREEIDNSPYPAIVCGDFNDVPNSYAYETIGKGLQNAFVAKGSGLGRTFSGISPTLRIDNIFAGKEFVIQQFTRVKQKLSDHFPLIADVNLRP